jgi:hypothetical protein
MHCLPTAVHKHPSHIFIFDSTRSTLPGRPQADTRKRGELSYMHVDKSCKGETLSEELMLWIGALAVWSRFGAIM